jgi:hypothetical protein
VRDRDCEACRDVVDAGRITAESGAPDPEEAPDPATPAADRPSAGADAVGFSLAADPVSGRRVSSVSGC